MIPTQNKKYNSKKDNKTEMNQLIKTSLPMRN